MRDSSGIQVCDCEGRLEKEIGIVGLLLLCGEEGIKGDEDYSNKGG